MSDLQMASEVITAFALRCEDLYAYGRKLRDAGTFPDWVISHSNIRHLYNGWRLQAWIETLVDEEEGYALCWWLEMMSVNGKIVIEHSINLGYGGCGFSLDFDPKTPSSIDEVKVYLQEAIDELTTALERNEEVANAARPYLRS